MALVAIAAILLDGLLVKLPDAPKSKSSSERIGVVHIHTRASDGSGTVAEVVDAARDANLSFVAITDHNVAMTEDDLAADPPDLPVLSGEELSTKAGHFLALGLPPSWTSPKTKDERELLAATRSAGAFRVLAHPFHPVNPWTDWQTNDFDGMEIWNEDAAWRKNNLFDLAAALLLYGENSQLAMVRLARTPDESFAKWDQLLAERPVAGMCGADAHERIRLTSHYMWRFPSYGSSLRLAREHVLIGQGAGTGADGNTSAAEIVAALRHGHSFCALDSLYPANGFSFRVSSGSGSGGPGDFLPWTGTGRLQISTPSGPDLPLVRVFRDGQKIIEEQTRSIDQPISAAGRYRVEAYLRQPGLTGWRRWTLWVFTNPVYVTAQ